MQYLYLDESGDLGFDFVNKKPSRFFTICIVLVPDFQCNRKLISAVSLTLRRKLNPPTKRKRLSQEMKATKTTLAVKQYLYRQVSPLPITIYAITLNKRRVFDRLVENKSRVYNWVTRQVLDHMELSSSGAEGLQLIIDKSKSKPEVVDFNQYIRRNLEARISPKTYLEIFHLNSEESGGLQVADMFSWGIFQKYERNNTEWFDVFKEKIEFEKLYLK